MRCRQPPQSVFPPRLSVCREVTGRSSSLQQILPVFPLWPLQTLHLCFLSASVNRKPWYSILVPTADPRTAYLHVLVVLCLWSICAFAGHGFILLLFFKYCSYSFFSVTQYSLIIANNDTNNNLYDILRLPITGALLRWNLIFTTIHYLWESYVFLRAKSVFLVAILYHPSRTKWAFYKWITNY